MILQGHRMLFVTFFFTSNLRDLWMPHCSLLFYTCSIGRNTSFTTITTLIILLMVRFTSQPCLVLSYCFYLVVFSAMRVDLLEFPWFLILAAAWILPSPFFSLKIFFTFDKYLDICLSKASWLVNIFSNLFKLLLFYPSKSCHNEPIILWVWSIDYNTCHSGLKNWSLIIQFLNFLT